MKILLVNGPNLQLLGSREPEIYGRVTLAQIIDRMRTVAGELDIELADRQSNHEGDLVDWIGSAPQQGFDGIVINPAAYTHTSVAVRDALSAAALPAVEVHMSNVQSREDFRTRSLTAPACVGVFCGFGADTYEWALRALVSHISKNN